MWAELNKLIDWNFNGDNLELWKWEYSINNLKDWKITEDERELLVEYVSDKDIIKSQINQEQQDLIDTMINNDFVINLTKSLVKNWKTVFDFQKVLKDKWFYIWKIDWWIWSNTIMWLTKFQESVWIIKKGLLDINTLEKLFTNWEEHIKNKYFTEKDIASLHWKKYRWNMTLPNFHLNPWNIHFSKTSVANKYSIWYWKSKWWTKLFVFATKEKWLQALTSLVRLRQKNKSKTLWGFLKSYAEDTSPYLSYFKSEKVSLDQKISEITTKKLVDIISKIEWFKL